MKTSVPDPCPAVPGAPCPGCVPACPETRGRDAETPTKPGVCPDCGASWLACRGKRLFGPQGCCPTCRGGGSHG